MRPYTEVVSAKNVLMTDLGPIGSLDSPVIKQIAQLSNPYSGVFSTSCPAVPETEINILIFFADFRNFVKSIHKNP